MRRARKAIAGALDRIGLKRPIRSGLDRVLAAGGFRPIGEPHIFRELEALAASPRPRPAQASGKLLVFSMRGWTVHVALEAMLGEAAAQRGMEVSFFTCGGPLPLCGITSFRAPDPTPCADCFGYVSRCFRTLGFPFLTLGELVDEQDRRAAAARIAALPAGELEDFEHQGLPLGRLTRISVLWFLLRGSPPPGPEWESTYRRFLVSAVLLQQAIERLLDRTRPDQVLAVNGLFFAERILRAVAGRRGLSVVTYERGFLPDSWVFRRDAAACDYEIDEDFRSMAASPLSPAERERVQLYLQQRSRGEADVAAYWPAMTARREVICRELGLDPSRPIVTAFSNITWDSAIQDKDIAFTGMFDWLERTVRVFAAEADAQLVIRVHPAEVRLAGLESSEGVAEGLAMRLGALPPGVRIVPAGSPLSSYTLGLMSRFVVVYTSTIGLELATQGVPVVVAGKTHYRGLGFTLDVARAEDYAPLLSQLLRAEPPRPDVELALRYSHFFLFRFMFPLPKIQLQGDGHARVALRSFEELSPGKDPVIDAILEGLLHGGQFFLPEPERLPGRSAVTAGD